MANIIIKKTDHYNHFNRALGKKITSKRHYETEMKKQGMIPYEQAKEVAENKREKEHRDYTPSEETRKFLYSVKDSSDSRGNIQLSGQQIKYMEKVGVNFKRPKERPLEGGWE